MATYEKGTLYNLDLSLIQADPNQPRKVMDEQSLDELAATIRKHGVLEPILFRVAPDGGIYVVAGERRVAASRKVGLTTIPAILVGGKHGEIALVENLLRQDLTAVEEAEALQALMTEQNYTQEQLAGVIGKARTTIGDILTLTRLPQEIRDECRGNTAVTRKTLITIRPQEAGPRHGHGLEQGQGKAGERGGRRPAEGAYRAHPRGPLRMGGQDQRQAYGHRSHRLVGGG